MKASFFILLLFATVQLGAQTSFRSTKASRKVNVHVKVGACVDQKCGPIQISFFWKRSSVPFQTVTVSDVDKYYIENRNLLIFGDLDFDRHEDVAIVRHLGGPYAHKEMAIYLYSRKLGRYVYNESISQLSREESLDAFDTDAKKEVFYTTSRLGGGVFCTSGYQIKNGQALKVSEVTTDITDAEQIWMKITTRKLVHGQGRSWGRRVPCGKWCG